MKASRAHAAEDGLATDEETNEQTYRSNSSISYRNGCAAGMG
jgi:hypothetical protein